MLRACNRWASKEGLQTPVAFFHRGRQIRLVVHGDDFTALGRRTDLWYEQDLARSFEIKIRGRIGEGIAPDQNMMRVLNRIVEVHDDKKSLMRLTRATSTS